MRIWFTADHHFFHENVLKYCDRPFRNMDKMHKTLIENHNKLVDKNDLCYFVGDFAMLKKQHIQKIDNILKQMNGYKELILGNHDDGKPFSYVKNGFDQVHTRLVLPYDNRFVLMHDPVESIMYPNKYCIVGHVHQLFKIQNNCINVGVDVCNYALVSFKMIKNNYITYVDKNN